MENCRRHTVCVIVLSSVPWQLMRQDWLAGSTGITYSSTDRQLTCVSAGELDQKGAGASV